MDKAQFKKKWENYWYYYKWHTIAGIFVLMLVIIFVKDFVTKEKYDATIMLATSYYVDDTRLDNLKDTLEDYFPDIDGNGEVNLAITPIYIEGGEGGQPTDAEYAYAMQMKMLSEVSVNSSLIVIFDDGFTNSFVEQMEMRDLSKDFPDNALISKTLWDITASDFGSKTFIPEYEKQTGTKVYASITSAEYVPEKEVSEYNQVLQGFFNIINNTPIN